MIHRMEIENFSSIRNKQVIDLRAAAKTPDDPRRLCPIWRASKEKAPKVVALFGPNASGKSNVLRALSFVAWFIRDSFGLPPDARLPFERFNDAISQTAPSRLAVYLAGPEDPAKIDDPECPQCRYVYEVVIVGGAAHAVESESLHYWPSGSSRKIRLLGRTADGQVSAAKAFGLTGYRQALEKVLRPNASVLSTLAQLNHPFATRIRMAASTLRSNILIDRHEPNEGDLVRHYAANPRLVDAFNREIERVDFGVRAMEVTQGRNDGPVAIFHHEGLAHPMPLAYESHGTRQFLKFYPVLLDVLESGGIAILDELDTAIHPLILPEILRWFHDPDRNPHGAQLWMSCHSAPLLEDLTKEEILFCEKDHQGRTEIYGLKDVQSVRRTDNFHKKYLGGVYGAIPQIG